MSAPHITADTLSQYIRQDIQTRPLILDTRDQTQFMQGHIPGSANVKCTTANQKQIIMAKTPRNFKIILVDTNGSESIQDTVIMMTKFGFDAYYLKDGIAGWSAAVPANPDMPHLQKSEQSAFISSQNLWDSLQTPNNDNNDNTDNIQKDIFLLDVRDPQEFAEFQIKGATNIPLSQLVVADLDTSQQQQQQQQQQQKSNMPTIPKDKKVVTICSHGNRSMIASIVLAKNGIESSSLDGGMAGWNQVLNPIKIQEQDSDLTIIQVQKVGKGCLSHIIAASNGEALVIDPTYPPTKFIEIAQKENLRITAVADTHQHADHVSAAAQLAKATNANLYLSATEEYKITEYIPIHDGDTITLGDKKIVAVHTPGHTAGSTTYMIDSKYVFSGDILFVEGVGRPDLKDQAEQFAGQLYDTIHKKILTLDNAIKIFPTHHTLTTKPTTQNGIYYTTPNIAKKLELLQISKPEFVKKMISITTTRPMNYSIIIKVNRGEIPAMSDQIPDLEMGPNRCSIT